MSADINTTFSTPVSRMYICFPPDSEPLGNQKRVWVTVVSPAPSGGLGREEKLGDVGSPARPSPLSLD